MEYYSPAAKRRAVLLLPTARKTAATTRRASRTENSMAALNSAQRICLQAARGSDAATLSSLSDELLTQVLQGGLAAAELGRLEYTSKALAR